VSRSVPQATVTLDVADGVGVLTLDNPPVGALSRATIDELGGLLAQVAGSGVGVLVVCSAVARAFGAGADLKLLDGIDAEGYGDYLDAVRGCVDRLAGLPLVSIAAIDGIALGGGLELALACTFRVGGPDARIGLPEIKLAMLPGAGGTTRLTRLVGRDRALELLLSGRTIDAAEALRLGVVSRVAATSAADDATAWAAELARAPRTAVAAILACVEAAMPMAEPPGAEVEDAQARRLFATDEAQDAIRAFVEARRGAARSES
jgi:enoyl-CoA hydratase/carnithine racemase